MVLSDNRGWSHLEILNLVTSEKALLPCKFTFTGSLWTRLLVGLPFKPLHSTCNEKPLTNAMQRSNKSCILFWVRSGLQKSKARRSRQWTVRFGDCPVYAEECIESKFELGAGPELVSRQCESGAGLRWGQWHPNNILAPGTVGLTPHRWKVGNQSDPFIFMLIAPLSTPSGILFSWVRLPWALKVAAFMPYKS